MAVLGCKDNAFLQITQSLFIWILLTVEGSYLVEVIPSQILPLVVRPIIGGDGQVCLALVQKSLYEDVTALSFLRAVEHQLDVTGHWKDTIITPVGVELVEVVNGNVAIVEFQQTGQWHHADLMTEAQGDLWLRDSVGSLDDVLQKVQLTEWHLSI